MRNNRLFEVTITLKAIVEGKDEADAFQAAKEDLNEILEDHGNVDIDVVGPLNTLADVLNVGQGWDGVCLPYGSERNTRIKEWFNET